MNTAEIKQILQRNRDSIAFVIGNGINRYPGNPNALSWDELLIQLWDKVSFQTLSQRPNGISVTEFYDILELENTNNLNLQKEFCDLMANWEPLEHHRYITNKIREWKAPILTTNFEETLAKTIDYSLLRTENEGFTDFYPWTTYHGINQLDLPTNGFGIWYINGMVNYYRSVRLGLTQYMGSVERARGLLHKGNEERLFGGKNQSFWKGHKTWLHIIFNKSLFIFGLGLEENETFLRWLLIERSKYFRKYPDRKYKGWYLMKRDNNGSNIGKKFFLERVGFEIIEVDSYDDIYRNIWE